MSIRETKTELVHNKQDVEGFPSVFPQFPSVSLSFPSVLSLRLVPLPNLYPNVTFSVFLLHCLSLKTDTLETLVSSFELEAAFCVFAFCVCIDVRDFLADNFRVI